MSADRLKIRAVFDCMVFLQGAARRESPAGACLLLAELEAVELCLSEEILSEIRDVLARPSGTFASLSLLLAFSGLNIGVWRI